MPHTHLRVSLRTSDDALSITATPGEPEERTVLDAAARALKDAII